jgi:hypothetical protein
MSAITVATITRIHRTDRPVNTGTHSGRSTLITCSTARPTIKIIHSYGTTFRCFSPVDQSLRRRQADLDRLD